MMRAQALVLLCTLLYSGEAFHFAPAAELARPAGRHGCLARGLRQQKARPSVSAVSMVWLDGWIAAAKYRETCPPQSCVEQLLLDQIRKQDFDPSVLHLAHPATMLLLVAPSMAYATYLGWKIRSSEGWALGSRQRRSAGSTHALLMSTAAIFSVFGVQGGLGSMLLADQPILESPHAATGFAFALLLGLQVRRLQSCVPVWLPTASFLLERKLSLSLSLWLALSLSVSLSLLCTLSVLLVLHEMLAGRHRVADG